MMVGWPVWGGFQEVEGVQFWFSAGARANGTPGVATGGVDSSFLTTDTFLNHVTLRTPRKFKREMKLQFKDFPKHKKIICLHQIWSNCAFLSDARWPVPSGYPNPTRYPVFLSIPDPTQFSFGNHRVAGNPKHRVLPDISGKPEVSGITRKRKTIPSSGALLWDPQKGPQGAKKVQNLPF